MHPLRSIEETMGKEKPTILFYCQHSLGMGHLVRSLALADSLSAKFRVVLLNGGKLPRRIRVPVGVEIVNLPPLGFDENNHLVSRDGRRTLERARTLREKLILQTYRAEKPEVVLIELFPFGRKKFANELIPLLEEAKGRSKIVCSLRDILVGRRKDQAKFEERAIETANRLFDAILVHSDPDFARLEGSFKTTMPLSVPIFYTGFVAARSEPFKQAKKQNRVKRIIVSAGGGMVGADLFRTAIQAHMILSKSINIETTVVGGLFLPEMDWTDLHKLAGNDSRLTFRRFVPKLRNEMSLSDVSVSQCGYNTALDILLSGVSAVVVPFGSGAGEDEQTKRARRLEKIGALKVCEGTDAERLASEIEKAFTFQPQQLSLNFDGGGTSTAIISMLLTQEVSQGNWLEPVKRALGNRVTPIKVFFRDDDAGVENERLFCLMDVFKDFAAPLDVAVIPKAVSKEFAEKLRKRIASSGGLFSIHQHGYSHNSHERENRKCEFGPARNKRQQFADIAKGQTTLAAFFGELPQPIFTPPWNRCTNETVKALNQLGFKVLSRESRAERLILGGLREIPISVDWFAKRKGIPLTRHQIGMMIADEITSQNEIGIMLHHAQMDKRERGHLRDLLALFAGSGWVQMRSIWSLFEASQETERAFAHVI